MKIPSRWWNAGLCSMEIISVQNPVVKKINKRKKWSKTEGKTWEGAGRASGITHQAPLESHTHAIYTHTLLLFSQLLS